MNTETKRKLNAMLMHDFITAIEAQEANSSMYLPMSFDDRFNAIIDDVYQQRHNEKIQRRIKIAKLRYPEASIANIDFKSRSLNESYFFKSFKIFSNPIVLTKKLLGHFVKLLIISFLTVLIFTVDFGFIRLLKYMPSKYEMYLTPSSEYLIKSIISNNCLSWPPPPSFKCLCSTIYIILLNLNIASGKLSKNY